MEEYSLETQRNLKMLDDFFTAPETCRNPEEFLKKRRALAKNLYDSIETKIVPINSLHREYSLILRL